MGMITIGTSGLMAYQSALDNTANNIENALTPGYNRRRVGLTEVSANGKGFGVNSNGIERIYNDYLTAELRNNASAYHQAEAYSEYAGRLDSFLGDENASVKVGLTHFFSSLQNLISDPASTTSRNVFINQSEFLVNQFKNSEHEIDSQFHRINLEIESSVNRINTLTTSVANINKQVSGTSEPSATLLDQRDLLLGELAELTSIYTSDNLDGTTDVYLSSGEVVILGGKSYPLSTQPDQYDMNQVNVTLESNSGSVVISNNMSGGRIGGLLDYKNDILVPSKQNLDKLALVVSDAMNQQHRMGVDANNNLGLDIFADINNSHMVNNRLSASASNTGSGNLSVTIDNTSELVTSDYQLLFTDPTNYTLTRRSDGAEVAAGSIAGFPAQISADGFTIDVASGAFTTGDKFRVDPLKGGTNNLSLEIRDPSQLALAAPIRLENNFGNTGSGMIEFVKVSDIENTSFSVSGHLSPPITVEFLSDTSYQLVNSTTLDVIEGPLSFTPNVENNIFPTPGGFDPGYEINLSGKPRAGDQFNVDYNNDAIGDNRNGQLLGHLQSEKLIENRSTFQDGYNQLANNVSTKTNFSNMAMLSSETLLAQSQSSRDAISGVNMDEEVANLMIYQQAYQASAQLIAIADGLFQTLVGLL